MSTLCFDYERLEEVALRLTGGRTPYHTAFTMYVVKNVLPEELRAAFMVHHGLDFPHLYRRRGRSASFAKLSELADLNVSVNWIRFHPPGRAGAR